MGADMDAAFAPRVFADLAITNADDLVFGVAPQPVRCGLGLEIGSGKVYPEVNFTLPTMSISDETWREVCAHYEEIASQVLARAARLKSPGLVLEFELLPAMTERPEWGAEITRILKRHLAEANQEDRTAVRPSRHTDRHSREGQASPDAARRSLRGALSLVRTQRRGRRGYFVDRVGRRQGGARQSAGVR